MSEGANYGAPRQVLAELKEKKYRVIGGPGKWDLALACFEPGKIINFSMINDNNGKYIHSGFIVTGFDHSTNNMGEDVLALRVKTAGKQHMVSCAPATAVVCCEAIYNLRTRQGDLRVLGLQTR